MEMRDVDTVKTRHSLLALSLLREKYLDKSRADKTSPLLVPVIQKMTTCSVSFESCARMNLVLILTPSICTKHVFVKHAQKKDKLDEEGGPSFLVSLRKGTLVQLCLSSHRRSLEPHGRLPAVALADPAVARVTAVVETGSRKTVLTCPVPPIQFRASPDAPSQRPSGLFIAAFRCRFGRAGAATCRRRWSRLCCGFGYLLTP